jgi:3-oxoacyl-[acyl-carrier protein] reductase
MNLFGKKIIVTGGSRGIGAAIVKELAIRGASVAFSYASQKDRAEKLLNELPGSGHQIFQLELNKHDEIAARIEPVLAAFGELHGLVNNAGMTRDQLALRMKAEDFLSVLQTNLVGSFLVTQQVLKPFLKARSGSVVNISSVIAHIGNPGQANYAASKAGLEAMTRSLAAELASRSIRVNSVAPGFIGTDMTEGLKEEAKASILAKIPLSRMGDPVEIAHPVAFLLSDEASYITGQTLHVNGGMWMS